MNFSRKKHTLMASRDILIQILLQTCTWTVGLPNSATRISSEA